MRGTRKFCQRGSSNDIFLVDTGKGGSEYNYKLANEMQLNEPQQCGMCDHPSLRSACAYAQSDQSLCKSLEYYMSVKLLTEHHFEFLSLKGAAQTRLSLH